MTAKTGRFPALRATLIVLALLMALFPSGSALADLTATGTEAPADDPATEAPATDVAEEPAAEPAPAPAPEPDPPADDPGVIAESGGVQVEEAAPADTDAEPAAAPSSKGSSANTGGPYDPSGVGEPSGNGNGGGGNKPCAGCVGNADGKNPPGQLPGGPDDGNNGYECDGNSGAGRTNPAHSGCKQVQANPDISLVKTGPTTAKVGDVIIYEFDVENTGNEVLTNVNITDPLIGGGPISVTPSTLAVGQSGTASALYTVRAQDINVNDEIPNTATVHGTDPGGDVVTDQDSWVVHVPPIVIRKHTICHATGKPDKYVIITPSVRAIVTRGHLGTHHHGGRDIIPPFQYDIDGDGDLDTVEQRWDAEGQDIFNAGCKVAPAPAIELIKDGPAEAEVGDTITYTFDVTNTGNTSLANVHVTDPLLGGTPITVTPSTLAANGGTGTATAQYTIRAQDVNADDELPNTATAHGTPPAGPDVRDTDDHIVVVPDEPDDPAIALVKDGPARAELGETIVYTFDVTNTGDTPLTNVHVTDPLLGDEPIAVTPSTLAVGAEGVASAEYTIDSVDLIDKDPLPPGADPGDRFLPNTATAHGTAPDNSEVLATDDHEVVVPAPGGPGDPDIELEKDGPATARVGETVTYTFTVTNTGDVTLTNVHVQDPLISSRRLPVAPSTLQPGDVGKATATYKVTKADGEAGEILNTAITRGTPPTGPDVEDRDDHDIDVPPPPPPGPEPDIELVKSGPETARVGDTITYRFRATNTGNTTLTNVHITDARLGIENLAVTPSTLLPGESGTATATYTVTQADADAGSIHNTAIVTGTPPDGPPVTDRDTHITDIPGVPPGPPPPNPPDLPATGTNAPTQLLLAGLALMLGAALLLMARRTTPQLEAWTTGTLPGQRLSGSDTPQPVHRRHGGGTARPAL